MKRLIKKVIGARNVHIIRSIVSGESAEKLFKKRSMFYAQFLKKGDLYFDIGANFGNRIQPVVEMGITIVAVEPQQECVAHLTAAYGNRITIIPMGVGAKAEKRTMYISDEKSRTVSSFSREFISAAEKSGRFSGYTWSQKRQIEMTTIDALIARFGVPRFMKIDVEGFEEEALKGLSRPVETISFEFTVPEQSATAVACVRRISKIAKGKVQFNYSAGESMKWKSEEWLSPALMEEEVGSARFLKTGFGDIYARTTIEP